MEISFKFPGAVLLLCAMLSPLGPAHASGFALIELNASGQGNAYAGAAAGTSNASTIYFNPAGMMAIEGDQLAIAAHYIAPSADFHNDGSTGAAILGGAPLTGDEDDGGQSAFVPNLYWMKTLNEKTKFGLGINSPFGLAVEYDEDWVGRYHAILSDLRTVNINPSIAYRVNDKVSVGGGVSYMLADAKLSNAIDFGAICVAGLGPAACGGAGATPQGNDGMVELDADNDGDFGFNLGLLFQLSDRTRIGVAYRSEVDISVSGTADFTLSNNATANAVATSTGAFADSDIDVDVTLPDSLSISLAHQAGKFTWLFDITRTGWSSFDELRVEFENPAQPDSVTTEEWDDTMRYSAGFDYQYSDKMILRAGLALDETPVPSAERRTPRLPGNDRTWLSVGLSYMTSSELSFDFGYSHLFIDDAEINNTYESGIPTLAATLVGEYEGAVDIFSAQLNWNLE